MNRPKQALQRAVFQHFDLRARPGVFAFHPANGGWRSRVEAAILKSLGVRAGVPDAGLKAPGGRLTAIQKAVHDAMRAAGAMVATATGLDEALIQLEAWGLLRGTVGLPSAGMTGTLA